jgi:hypothetical protein
LQTPYGLKLVDFFPRWPTTKESPLDDRSLLDAAW